VKFIILRLWILSLVFCALSTQRSPWGGPSQSLFPAAFEWFKELLISPMPLQSALRRALFLGDGSALPRDIWKSFNHLGLSHLLVISGSHISMAIAFIYSGSWIFRSIGWYRVFILAIVGAYCGLCSPGVSIARAYLCFVVLALGAVIWPALYRYSSYDRLGFVGILLLAIKPSWSLSPSYLLSFVASLAILSCRSDNQSSRVLAVAFTPAAGLLPLCHLLQFELHPLSPWVNFIFGPVFWLAIVPASFLGLVDNLTFFSESFLNSAFALVRAWSEALSQFGPANRPPPLLSVMALSLFFVGILEIANSRRRLIFMIGCVLSYQLFLFSDKLYFDF